MMKKKLITLFNNVSSKLSDIQIAEIKKGISDENNAKFNEISQKVKDIQSIIGEIK